MSQLNDVQVSTLKAVFSAAPDTAVEALEAALAQEAVQGGSIARVHGLVAEEARERRMRSLTFAPLLPLCRSNDGVPPRFPPGTLLRLWAAVKTVEPGPAERVRMADARRHDPEASREPDACDALCAAAAAGLRENGPAFEAVVNHLLGARPDGPEDLASMLDLAPIARRATPKLGEWVGRANEEKSAAMRLAYRDATALAEDAGPRLLDILMANLAEPWLILRILSAVMDHPAERYVAVSELARFGEAVMDDIDRRLARFREFDPAGGRPAGLAAGEALHVTSVEIAEFESQIELSREGVWGKRIAKQKQSVAILAETRLGQIEKAIDAALPQQMVRFGKGLKGLPKLVADPDPIAQRKAEGLLSFYASCRSSASQSGYGTARAKVGEKVIERLDQYIEDLLETIRAEEIEHLDRAKAYIEVAAGFVETAEGEQAGQIVRRRAAAA
jgi:hypothetical protein